MPGSRTIGLGDIEHHPFFHMDFLPGDQFAILPVGVGIGHREVDVLIARIARESQFDDLLVGNRLASYLAWTTIDDDGDGLILTGSLTAVDLAHFFLLRN